ncbi:bursicon-like [Bacillus rossius redtenbacheri]|uniref:bursicon-like n=1 Tax=Bacillus rossius redtenbacheri TaxID=93214 RepID=UPI002FDE2D87
MRAVLSHVWRRAHLLTSSRVVRSRHWRAGRSCGGSCKGRVGTPHSHGIFCSHLSNSFSCKKSAWLLGWAQGAGGTAPGARSDSIADDCQLTPVIHVLQYPGCVPKPIPSFACNGRCGSYVQVSGSKIWQMERSCMCCQESGEREASVSLFCPKARNGERKFRKVTTKAPLECMCRPCTSVEESAVIPQEIAGYSDISPLNDHFAKPQ